ncbi:MAG: DNA translocase FtsK [Lachnospiraceae bacterium]|nr:DNA translocase FtsK [Lachnospiraceae bacterium]
MASRPGTTKNKKRSAGEADKNGKNSRSAKSTSSGPEVSFQSEVILLVILAVCIVLFISNFGIGGFLGEKVSVVSFGLFGMMAYIFPICFFMGAAFYISNRDNGIAIVKLAAGILFVAFLCLFVELVAGSGDYSVIKSFQYAAKNRSGGGALGGMLASLMCPAIGTAGTYVVDIITLIISMVLLTERSFLGGVRKGSRRVYNSAREDAARRREMREQRREEEEFVREEQAQRRMDKKVEGVAFNTRIQPASIRHSDNISELKLPLEEEPAPSVNSVPVKEDLFTLKETPEAEEPVVVEKIHRKPKKSIKAQQEEDRYPETMQGMYDQAKEEQPCALAVPEESQLTEPARDLDSQETENLEKQAFMEEEHQEHTEVLKQEMQDSSVIPEKDAQSLQYRLPPVALLKSGGPARKDNQVHLHETAVQLQNILKNFGVNVTITNVSCGPSVTRYELQPELGVKVSKIVNLADDIKLNLAAADIRIEAPIPGKAAVGIEVPNKENVMVRFRELIESADFQKHQSSICFTAGKDIGGQVVVADIAKMPHLLIAGATGSGKSVCINTIIMSILYKADPEDVKLILIDPKVVELSVYNGIPHLFIPVVTDPKKAAGALHWAVSEMTDRYQKFADYQVRDLKGYNKKVEAIKDVEDETKPKKLPQIVIVVDELADLMMVAPGDVEDAICRLAQLARAAGIHLIIATQRPSVDVITGLIKANMPSRIAFSVSSGVDSRTILDMNGAEKLLGNGDMLFYPQGYQKPLRVQGPFVSDQEVEAVVDFLKKQSTAVYNTEIEEKMNTVSISQSGTGGGSERDAYFVEAGKFVIEKDKGSIGMLQRMFKIGFNRAARIMDQLEEAGVVGPEEGTKARKILMSLSEFEEYVDEYV